MNQDLILPMIEEILCDVPHIGHRLAWDAIEALVYMYGSEDRCQTCKHLGSQVGSCSLCNPDLNDQFEPNQCDGCRRGLPVVAGIHCGDGYDMIACTKRGIRCGNWY